MIASYILMSCCFRRCWMMHGVGSLVRTHAIYIQVHETRQADKLVSRIASDSKEETSQPSEWEEQCKEWVNFSSFVARCTEARIDDHIPDFTKYPWIDIEEGLEKDFLPGPKRDSRVMVAAQYILLAGHVISEEFVQKPRREGKFHGVEKWQLWAGKLKELAETQTELAPDVRDAVVESRKKLISLHPELFSESERGIISD